MSENALGGGAIGDVWNTVSAPFRGAPTNPGLKAPNALSSQPTEADASAAASKKTLDDERNQASTASIVNQGGAGGDLTDTPTTSSSLVGT